MLHIISLILKIIGIVLLCLIGIILVSVLCALFVPVRYQVKVAREGGEDKPPVKVYVKITWLLHLVNILIRYPADVMIRARIMLFTVFRAPSKEKKESKTTKRKKRNRKEPEERENKEDQGNKEEQKEPEAQENSENDTQFESEADSSFNPFELGTLDEELKQKSQTEQEDKEPSATDGRFSVLDKIRKFLEKIKGFIDNIKRTVDKLKKFFENIQYTIRKFCDKIKSTLDNIQYYQEVLESDSFKRSLELCKGELSYVFRTLKPDVFVADITAGMEDPAAMGQILGFYGMLYPVIGQHVRLVGDFESEGTHVEGELYIRGKIRAYTFLRIAIRIYRNKDIRTLIKLLKKEAA